jgi:tRNA A37 threonylcarbamoyladenosine modification protein TsaB
MAASGACLQMLGELLGRTNKTISDVEVFVADIGPGSFTGVKVAVTLAKTLAFATGKMAGGITSFDLISVDHPVVVPSRKGEWFLRQPGATVERVAALPNGDFLGYGSGVNEQTFPDAANASGLLIVIKRVAPEHLVPNYIAEPSISTPKRPYGVPGASSA